MSLAWTVLGTIGQLLLAYLLFMLVAFSGGGLVSGTSLGKRQRRILDLALFVLPGLCVASAIIVIGLQVGGAGAGAYGWYALPLAATAAYIAYVVKLARRTR
ncbi:MAG TPA: hypothetical protein VFL63_05670 [Rhodanobacteraceae bacterium]|nr:hypothetical protein [Rhodanobacteraceae bacterium]